MGTRPSTPQSGGYWQRSNSGRPELVARPVASAPNAANAAELPQQRPLLFRSEPGVSGSDLEVVRVREKAPPRGTREQVVRRPRVPKHVSFGVEGVPAHGREGRVLAKLMSLDFNRRPGGGTSPTVCVHRLREVIAH